MTILLKEQFEMAKKNQKFSEPPKTRTQFKEEDTGFLNVRKIRCQACTQGFTFRYKWFDVKEDRERMLSSVNFLQLKNKVKNAGLKWEVDNYYIARKTASALNLPLLDLK